MKKLTIALVASVAFAPATYAQIAVIDGANLETARKNAENTKAIMDSNKDIQEKTIEILTSLTGQRQSNLGIGNQGLGGGMSVAQAPSFGSVLNGGALSFGGLNGDIQKIAGAIINGLQLVKSLKDIANGNSGSNPFSAINDSYSGAVNVSGVLSAINQQATQGVQSRESSLQSATGQIGQSQDVKGSVDENTRMQAESARAVNELIGVQNAAVAAANEDLKQRLLRQSQVTKILAPAKVGWPN